MAATTVSLKLLIDTSSNRVLFAEAGKDFVDFLFNILCLPVGTVVRLLTKENMVGCLGNLYESIENLNETYMQPNQNKESLLKPTATTEVPLLLPNVESSPARKVYTCRNRCSRYVAEDTRAVCPQCRNVMNEEVTFVPPPAETKSSSSGEGGYVKGVVTYSVMDDLVVKPMSTISSITLLNKFNIKEVGALEEKVIVLGMDEV